MVRHGESEGNRDRRFTISPEVPITELGRQQALEAAQRIASIFKPRAGSSQAPIVAHARPAKLSRVNWDLPIEIVNDLHERDLGVLKGESYDLLRDLAGQDSGYDPKRGWLWRPEGGESYEDVRQRVIVAIDEHSSALSRSGTGRSEPRRRDGSMWAHLTGQWEGAICHPTAGSC